MKPCNIPNHTDCFQIRSYLVICRDCDNPVIYYNCTSGSEVFLDPPDRGKHNCDARPPNRKERAKQILKLFEYAKRRDVEPRTQCPMCKTEMKTENMPQHFKKCPGRKRMVSASRPIETSVFIRSVSSIPFRKSQSQSIPRTIHSMPPQTGKKGFRRP